MNLHRILFINQGRKPASARLADITFDITGTVTTLTLEF